MDSEVVDVLAKISLTTTEDGGRSTPLNGSYPYRPNHNFFGEADLRMCMGEIKVPVGSSPEPGETFEAEIRLIVWPDLLNEITPGRKWRIQEGAKIVGYGEVIEVLSRF